MNRVAIDLGFLQIYWYSLFIFFAALVATTIIYLESKKREIDKDFVINLAFSTILWGIIGARIYYVLFNLDYYLSNPIEILEIWNGGLAIHGGMIAGAICVIINCKKYGVDTLKMLDIIVVGLIIGQAIGRWGNFFNSEAYGAVTTIEHLRNLHLPEFIINGMYILGEYRKPTFLYESILNVIGFIVLLVFRRKREVKKGQITGLYLMWYAVVRFIIEGSRADSLMLGWFKVARLVSIVIFIIGLKLYKYHKKSILNSFGNLYEGDQKEKEKRPLFYKSKDDIPKN